MSEMTPTTEDVKTHFANEFDSYHGWQWDEGKAQQFDRWFDAELRKAKREAWEEGSRSQRDIHGDPTGGNPYE